MIGSRLGHAPFALFWSSRVLATLALQMQTVAVGWQLYSLTGSALDLGLVGLVQFVPTIVLTLIVGQVADRYDRRLVVVACELAQAGAGGVLALGSLGGWLTRDGILTLVAILGAARAFENPARAAFVPRLVPLALLPRAIASVTSAGQTARIVGPALGGVLYTLGPATVYAVVAALYVVGATLIAFVRDDQPARVPDELTPASLFSGIAFIWRQRLLLGLMSLDLFAVLLGGATALLPIYARDILDTGPWGLGLLRAAPAVGALAISLVLTRHPVDRRAGPVLFAAVFVFGLATLVFGVSTSLRVSLAALVVLGASDLLSVVIRQSLVQIRTPDGMRGRVSAVHSLFTGTSNQLGEFESGLLAALFGAVPAVLIGGAGTLVVAAVWMYRFPELRRFELAG
ncbi:MAG: MFS transporter [Candidatus Rokuibacteriota bacterium]|nr:MAG: MFS transporter [Candidatus Rokubacteria bacterium]